MLVRVGTDGVWVYNQLRNVYSDTVLSNNRVDLTCLLLPHCPGLVYWFQGVRDSVVRQNWFNQLRQC